MASFDILLPEGRISSDHDSSGFARHDLEMIGKLVNLKEATQCCAPTQIQRENSLTLLIFELDPNNTTSHCSNLNLQNLFCQIGHKAKKSNEVNRAYNFTRSNFSEKGFSL